MDLTLDAPGTVRDFALGVGDRDPVTVVGGRTQWDVGGRPDPGCREVRAPAGVVEHVPAEMTVRVRAGTPVAALDAALAERGQMVPLDPADPARATVGGVLAVGHSGLRRLRYGPVRDTLLEARYVDARGAVVKAGGPVVKNVTGFDLCRLLVGSLGTLGLLAEVVLRVQPCPPVSVWLRGEADPVEVRRRLFRPSSILWDGTGVWVLLEGEGVDVETETSALPAGFAPVDGPPALPPHRWSLAPAQAMTDAATAPGRFVAEVGVGVVHREIPPPGRVPDRADLHRRIKTSFDPSGRLNPGRRPW